MIRWMPEYCEGLVVGVIVRYTKTLNLHENRSQDEGRTTLLRSCSDETAGRKTLDITSRARESQPCRDSPASSRSERRLVSSKPESFQIPAARVHSTAVAMLIRRKLRGEGCLAG